MKKQLRYISTALIFIIAFLVTCKKENNSAPVEKEVSFSIDISNSSNGSTLKSTLANKLSDARKIVLTIQNSDGTPTSYTSSKVNIYQMNGAFFSQKIMLKVGSYQLTEFLLLDSTENTIYAAPVSGSRESLYTSNPLPIAFEVMKDASSSVKIEVLSTKNKLPEDFGLVGFPISSNINFMITVSDKVNIKPMVAKLTISSGAYSQVQMLDSITNNIIVVKDNITLKAYTLTIEKEGYITYSHTFSKDSLKLFNDEDNNLPLLIELEFGTITDIDGNTYKTIRIGNKWWMAENLKTTKYNNGTPIPLVSDSASWVNLTTPGYCWYNNNETAFKKPYGALYNYYAINTGSLCPKGWHIPTYNEWNELLDYTMSDDGPGAKLKETGTTHWATTNTNVTNETGFTARPGGCRSSLGLFSNVNSSAYWWTSTEAYTPDTNIVWMLNDFENYLYSLEMPYNAAFSLRCVKD